MNVCALQTARKNSKSVINKNILEVKEKPLYLHNNLYAQDCELIKQVYVSTDSEFIKQNAGAYGYRVIDRPEALSGDDVSHHEVIVHGLEAIEADQREKVDILVILLGNNLGAYTEDLRRGIKALEQNGDADSVMSVSRYNMFNPFRAYEMSNGCLTTVVPQDLIQEKARLRNINDKDSAGDIYFFNGSFWICRRETVVKNEGLLPFPWLGTRIRALVQADVMEIDAQWQLKCLV